MLRIVDDPLPSDFPQATWVNVAPHIETNFNARLQQPIMEKPSATTYIEKDTYLAADVLLD
jgi:hypothetical protein